MEAPIVLALAAGVVSFLSPCIVPMISVYLTLITGMTMDELTARPGLVIRRTIVINTLLFALGFTIVFTLAGGAAGAIGAALQSATRGLEIVGGVVIILMGLSMAGVFRLRFLDKMRLPLKRPLAKPKGPLGSLVVGLLFAVTCSHCIAPTLLSMMAVAGTTGSPVTGMVTMLAFSLGLTVPYVGTAVAITPALRFLSGHKRAARFVGVGTGVFLAGFGILLLGGQFTRLVEISSRLLPFRVPLGM
ncbi:MAG TPA: cytochrome c biogenesis protein CcdA [Thermoleophilia bacterium]|nr:cytochrome c biogenesis protein CcdA [Thermoleophilia bacterium]